MKYFIIYTTDSEDVEVLEIIRRRNLESVEFFSSLVHRTDHYGNKQTYNILGPFDTENEAEREINNRDWKYIKPDRSERILRQLEKMFDEGEFSSNAELHNEIENLIIKVRYNEIDLNDYQMKYFKEIYGPVLVEAIAEAIRRQKKR